MEYSRQPENESTETSDFAGTVEVAAETEADVLEPSRGQSERHNENQTPNGHIISRGQRVSMYRAALKGDWQRAEELLKQNSDLAYAEITKTGETALHIAAAMKRTKFVKRLVIKLVKELGHDLSSLQNHRDRTALYYAAASGIRDIASVMMGQDENLPTILPKDKMVPLHMAVLFGNTDTASYFMENTQVESSPEKKLEIFGDIIRNRMYDVALEFLTENQGLATMENGEGTALHLLAQHDISDISACREAIMERLVTMFAAVPCLSWLKRKCEQPLMRKKARILAKKLWANMQDELKEEEIHKRIKKPPILRDAAKAGNVEFITMLTRDDPDLIWGIDDKNKYTIFHIAVTERQESVFSLIHQTGAMKNLIATSVDDNENNILHLAGKLAPPGRLSVVSGPALQMQRELMWFKEMEKILPPSCSEKKNKSGLRPKELFSKRHTSLLKQGETWMRDTADSCMLIATIMLTVAFTAAFTVPGGNNSDTGIPILLKRTWFIVFVASDAVAMCCSTTSITMFLSILTSRFQEDDFLVALPGKLLCGLLGLFGSLIGAILAFTSAYFLMFNVERVWLPLVLGCFLCVLLTAVFLFQHIPLFLDTISSTFRYGNLFRSSNHSLY